MLRQVGEFLEGETFSFGEISFTGTESFDEALELLRRRKVDLVILDVYRGKPSSGDQAGVELLREWKSVGFAPVVMYTALPAGLEDHCGPFVRLVSKEGPGSLERLKAEIEGVFRHKIPGIHRAIRGHLDKALARYMWGFVVENWDKIEGLTERADFVRLLLHRLEREFSREGVGALIESLYPGTGAVDPATSKVDPTEFYVKPPVGDGIQAGDLRVVGDQVFVVLWPSCDLVERDGGYKVERALCARTVGLADCEEHKEWEQGDPPSNNVINGLKALMSNNRRAGQAERYHFLPPAWDMTATLVDFQLLEHVRLAELRVTTCIATIASPFAEELCGRFVRYIGRLGTPDLDLDVILKSLT